MVSNPEFLREGAAIQDFKHPDRIVVGTDDERARQVMNELYRPLYLNAAPILVTDRRTAELIKYAANAFLATKITFINEIADLCEKVGADVQDVARGIGLDNRIGGKFLHAGPGLRRLVLSQGHARADQDRAGQQRAAAHRRDGGGGQRHAQARHGAQGHGGAWRVAARQDHRGAGADLQAEHRRHARRAVDPADHGAAGHGRERARLRSGRHGAGEDGAVRTWPTATIPMPAPSSADALVIVTEWEQFRALDLDRLKASMKSPVIVDLRNIYLPDEMVQRGFDYESVGRPNKV